LIHALSIFLTTLLTLLGFVSPARTALPEQCAGKGSILGGGVTTTYVTDTNGMSKVLQRTKNGVTTRYVWGVGLCYEVADDGTSSTYRYYHYDSTGSTVALTDGSGEVKERIQYSPYGMIIGRWSKSGTPLDTPFLYTGMLGNQTDPDGLIYMRARYYSPMLGRFLSGDPAREGSNWYAYAGGNPLGFVDPTGLGAEAALDMVQTTLGFIGLVPGVGIVADVFNSAISLGRGNYQEAALYGAAALTGGVLGVVAGSAARTEAFVAREGFTAGRSFAGTAASPWGAAEAAKTPLWTATKTKTPVQNAFRHWKDHGVEFPEFQNAKQYVEGTKSFFSNPPVGTLTKVRPNGDKLFYNPANNTFGVQAADGAPRTMFRPTDDINYWNKQ
jgi:RHS repeat-associated protein